MAPARSSPYAGQLLGSIRNDATSFIGHHITATFCAQASSRPKPVGVERSESLDDVEHSSTLIM
jgi:hypothetical protein